MMGTVTLSFAAPSGESVVSGNIVIDRNIANTTNIKQSTNKAIINWQNFDVNSNETVNFNLPNSSSSTLNRVTSSNPSNIYGQINSNGQVFLVNQNGIYFGENSSVNTAGFTASTLDITNENFLNSNYVFEGTSNASILNLGTITTDNAYTALLAKEVINEGVIQARLGNVQLASGEKISLDINGNSLVKLTIDKGTLDSLVENRGLVKADGGIVYLTTQALDTVLNGVVNNTGVIEANSVEEKEGRIILFAHGGTADIGGTLEAKDGFIETSGKEFTIAENTNVQAGHWLLDPINITIDTALATTLEGQLASGDATVTTAGAGVDEGDINVNSSIAWSANKLTLHADNDININAALNASATAGLALEYAQTTSAGTYNVNAPVNLASTGSFSSKKGADAVKNYTIITSLGAAGSTTGTDLQGINGGLSGKYVLGANIDASTTSSWNGGAGFNPLGDNTTKFTGKFDGLGHTISNLYINRPTEDYIGLFGYEDGGIISNLGLVNVDITGNNYIGGLSGYERGGTISNSYTTGSVTGVSSIGGFVGSSFGTISDSYSTASVTGNSRLGGFVGFSTANISNSYATGDVSGTTNVGGFVGDRLAGLVTNAYSTGKVTGTYNVGGFVGKDGDGGSITNSFWDMETSGRTTSDGGVGKTTAQMTNSATFTGWDTSIWSFGADDTIEGYAIGLPYLKNVTQDSTRETLFESGFGTTANPYGITNWEQLDNIRDVLTNNFYFNLLNSISSSTSNYSTYASTTANTNLGWNPLGDSTTKFKGKFDGKDYTISNLYINRPSTNYIGLFGYVDTGSSISNVGLVGGSISGGAYTGALAGSISSSTITNAYATGAVSGADATGGLVGYVDSSTITNSYATGAVTGRDAVGSLVGGFLNSSTIANSYGTGAVSSYISSTYIGGLVGQVSTSTITNSFWDTQTTGQATSAGGGIGLTTAQMKDTKTFHDAGWDFDTIWGRDTANVENSGYLDLRALNSDFTFNTVVALTVADQTKTYDGADSITATLSKANVIDSVALTGNKNVGTYVLSATLGDYGLTYATGYTSSNTETLLYNSGSQTITQKALTLSSITASNKVYDRTTTAAVTATLSGVITGDTVSNSISSTFDTKNAGTAKTVTLNSLTGTDSANYSITTGQTTTADVTQKTLTLSDITASNKVYDGTTTATTTAILAGIIAGDTVSNSIASTFDNKNSGTAKTVTLDSVTLAGADSTNYSIASGQTTTADVTQKTLTLSDITASNKVYDGTADATVNATLAGLKAGDSVSIASTFDDPNVGTAKTVTLNSLTGTDAANYSAILGQTTTADITAILVTPTSATANYQDILNSILRDAGNTKEIKEVFIKNNNLIVVLEDEKQLRVSKVSQEQLEDNAIDIKLALVPDRLIQLFNGGLYLPDGLNQDSYMLEEEN